MNKIENTDQTVDLNQPTSQRPCLWKRFKGYFKPDDQFPVMSTYFFSLFLGGAVGGLIVWFCGFITMILQNLFFGHDPMFDLIKIFIASSVAFMSFGAIIGAIPALINAIILVKNRGYIVARSINFNKIFLSGFWSTIGYCILLSAIFVMDKFEDLQRDFASYDSQSILQGIIAYFLFLIIGGIVGGLSSIVLTKIFFKRLWSL